MIDNSVNEIKCEKEEHNQKKRIEEIVKKAQAKISNGRYLEALKIMRNETSKLISLTPEISIEKYTIDRALQDIRNTPEGLKTGYERLDQIIRIPQAAITIIAGRPSHGKTTFLLNLFRNMIEIYPHYSFFYFSYEENSRQIFLKLINILAGKVINENQNNLRQLENYLKGNNTSIVEIEKAKTIYKKYVDQSRLWIISNAYYVDDLCRILIYLKNSYKVGAIFVDYIQKIKIKEKFKTRQIEIQKISEKILETANKLNLPIIMGAQLGREKAKISPVKLDNLREAGDIEQDANLVLGLYNESVEKAKEEKKNIKMNAIDLKVTILKNRNGPVNDYVTLSFDRPILTINDEND